MSAVEKDPPEPIVYADPGKYMLRAQMAITKLSKQKRLFDVIGHVSKDIGISYNYAAAVVQMLEQSRWISEPDAKGERKLLL